VKAIIEGVRAVCEAGAEGGGEAAAGFRTFVSSVDWSAAIAEPSDRPPPPSTIPHSLAAACSASSAPGSAARQLADAVAEHGQELLWRELYEQYDDEPDMATFRRGYAYTRLIGSGAPLYSDQVKAGLTLQCPDSYYPAHAHKAAEFYAVVGGTGEWRRGIEPWAVRPPGDFIFHPSGVRHAMQTSAEPLLALFAWIGDLDSPVVIVRG
jgi:mannose-6-phosphate isomerase-like protein (cupin superfamily)